MASKNTKRPYIKFRPKHFIASGEIGCMTATDIGAYVRLVCTSADHVPAFSLPNDDKALAEIAQVSFDEWMLSRKYALQGFELRDDGRLHHVGVPGFNEIGWIGQAVSKLKIYVLRRAERLRAARDKGRHSLQQWRELVALCCGICPRCECPATLTKDHIVPISLGGSDGIDNLQPLCLRCNISKKAETIDWLKARGLR